MQKGSNADRKYWILLAVSGLIVLYARLSLLAIPLERDEGGFTYIGQRLFGSQHLYSDLLDNKLPGLYFLYWLFLKLPGADSVCIHLGLLLVNAGALVLFFLWTRKAFHLAVASVATSLFAVSSLMPGVFGFAAHATQLLLLPVTGALYLLWNYLETGQGRLFDWRLPAAGLLLGFAFIVKQPAVVFIVFALAALMLEKGDLLKRLARSLMLGTCSVLPYAAIAGYFYANGRFDDFWLWTFKLPAVQTAGMDDSWFYFNKMTPLMVGNHWLFWTLGLLSLLIVPFSNFSRRSKGWQMGLLVSGLLSALIGLGFIPHYFVPAIPGAALGVAVSLYWLSGKISRENSGLFAGLSGVVIAIPLLLNFNYFFKPDYLQILEKCYHWNGFAEAKAIAAELKKRVHPGDKIAILGSEPEINYYTGTDNCTPHLFMYPIVREHALKNQYQQQFLRDVMSCNAEYVVLTASEASWGPDFANLPFFKRDLFPKITEQYDLIGRANIGQIPLSIVWDEALKTHNPPKCPPVFVFRRKQPAPQ